MDRETSGGMLVPRAPCDVHLARQTRPRRGHPGHQGLQRRIHTSEAEDHLME